MAGGKPVSHWLTALHAPDAKEREEAARKLGNVGPADAAACPALVEALRSRRIVVAPIDVSALRHERESRVGHHMLAHLRTEAYPVYRESGYPARQTPAAALSLPSISCSGGLTAPRSSAGLPASCTSAAA